MASVPKRSALRQLQRIRGGLFSRRNAPWRHANRAVVAPPVDRNFSSLLNEPPLGGIGRLTLPEFGHGNATASRSVAWSSRSPNCRPSGYPNCAKGLVLGRFSTSSHASSEWDGGRSMADEMIRYSLASKGQGLEESILTMKHGLSFLLREGDSACNAAGRVLLHLASLHVDMGNFSDAFGALQQAIMIKGITPKIEIAAREARIGLLLRCNQDDAALEDANESVNIVKNLEKERSDNVEENEKNLSQNLEQDDNILALKLRSLSSLAYVYHFQGKFEDSEKFFVEASSIQDKISEMNINGTAAAILADAHHVHAQGKLSYAQTLYEECLSLSKSAEGLPPHLVVADVAMKPQEVIIGALCGLGQLAIHKGDFEVAEKHLTAALNESESMSGGKHVRNGCILSILAHLYYCKGKTKSGDYLVSEGLYRKALELFKAELPKSEVTTKDFGMHDMIALTLARYAILLRQNLSREHEATMHHELSFTLWKSIWPIQLIIENGYPKIINNGEKDSKSLMEEISTNYGECTVVDIRLGRILM